MILAEVGTEQRAGANGGENENNKRKEILGVERREETSSSLRKGKEDLWSFLHRGCLPFLSIERGEKQTHEGEVGKLEPLFLFGYSSPRTTRENSSSPNNNGPLREEDGAPCSKREGEKRSSNPVFAVRARAQPAPGKRKWIFQNRTPAREEKVEKNQKRETPCHLKGEFSHAVDIVLKKGGNHSPKRGGRSWKKHAIGRKMEGTASVPPSWELHEGKEGEWGTPSRKHGSAYLAEEERGGKHRGGERRRKRGLHGSERSLSIGIP